MINHYKQWNHGWVAVKSKIDAYWVKVMLLQYESQINHSISTIYCKVPDHKSTDLQQHYAVSIIHGAKLTIACSILLSMASRFLLEMLERYAHIWGKVRKDRQQMLWPKGSSVYDVLNLRCHTSYIKNLGFFTYISFRPFDKEDSSYINRYAKFFKNFLSFTMACKHKFKIFQRNCLSDQIERELNRTLSM